MNRAAIRKYARFLIDEYTEEPEGLFLDVPTATEMGINDIINIALHNVQMDLIKIMPWYFRKTFLISVTALKREYTIATDLALSDFLIMEDIFYNETGSKPTPLIHADLDQINDHQINVGDKGEPRIWTYEGANSIAFDPKPSATLANKFKGFYFYRIPDLTHDTSDVSPNIATPSLPLEAHPLVAIETVAQLHLAGEEEGSDVEKLRQSILAKIVSIYSIRQGTSFMGRPPLKETVSR